jgi:hypothetical protein
MSIDTAALDRGREDCPVLPCVPYTPINADRLGQEGLAGPSDTDVGQSRQLTAALVVISTAQEPWLRAEASYGWWNGEG